MGCVDGGRQGAAHHLGPIWVALSHHAALIGTSGKPAVEKLDVNIGSAQGLLYAFKSLYVVVNEGREMAERPSGLRRLRDTKGTDQFDEIKLLRRFKGGGEHGPHAVILSPEGKSLYVVAGNFTKTPNPDVFRARKSGPKTNCCRECRTATASRRTSSPRPAGVCRTDPDGKAWELTNIGMRNCYDIAFNADGELFTYDNDMEWDIGLPWYRPTRVLHLASGSDSGWRNGSGKFPVYYPDNLPAAVDISVIAPGPGIAFGYETKFPAKYPHGT